MKNCAIGGCDQRHPNVCPTCKHWTPSRGSRYYFCARFQSARVTCDLPYSACETCSHFEGDIGKEMGPGRPNMSGLDWNNPEEVRKYFRDKMRESRERKEADKPERRSIMI